MVQAARQPVRDEIANPPGQTSVHLVDKAERADGGEEEQSDQMGSIRELVVVNTRQ